MYKIIWKYDFSCKNCIYKGCAKELEIYYVCLKAVFKQTIALNMTLIDFPEDMWKDTEEILTRLEK